jgi:hypothetical protein
MMIKKIFVSLIVALVFHQAVAREGMWIPMLLEKYNIQEMQSMGFKLTAEDIYSINEASMKDAVMIFGGGCTGELISANGLLVTNHHCGYSAIQSHSSVQNDYLTNGFWAMSRSEELPNPNLKVTFLKRMEDVTLDVLKGVSDSMSMVERQVIVASNIEAITKAAIDGTHYTANVESFYFGNQYFLFVNEVFTDVRLVGSPPSAIGKFGGNTDNWMWPRHTGDFSLFRIYADANNKPATYSADNVPYKSPVHFPISLKGVGEDDFTMVFGYPGNTSQYVTSYHVEMLANQIYLRLVDLRTAKLGAMNQYMEKDAAVRIKYAAKNASLSNSWKRWIGEINGLKTLEVVGQKQRYEVAFNEWVNATDERWTKYGTLLDDYQKTYAEYSQYRFMRDYLMEFIGRTGLESIRLAGSFEKLAALYDRVPLNDTSIQAERKKLEQVITDHFKDYYKSVDKDVTLTSLQLFKRDVSPDFLPDVFNLIDTKFKGNIEDFVNHYFRKSNFTDELSVNLFLDEFSAKSTKKYRKDPAFDLYNSLRNTYYNLVNPRFIELQNHIDSLNHIYMAAMMDFEPNRLFYPDANFTLRIAYGQVKGYDARDGVYFKHFSTLDGIMQKDNPDVYDYRVPTKLKDLYLAKDFGPYEENGTVPVCFIANNHTTGGNSGSPVLNDQGELIGINFDRVWEGVMSDIMFNSNQSRNISLDMRYVLFIIDKFAGAGYLLNEMTLVK